MAYADQEMSGNRITALIIVALIHVAVGWALVSGLAHEGMKKIIQRVTTVDIEEDKPEEPPPPPKKIEEPPPIFVPPPLIKLNPAPPKVEQTDAPPPPPPPPVITPPPAAVPPPPPPPPRAQPRQAQPRGNPGSWATTSDYPSRAQREGREGTTGFRVTVSPEGRVTSCSVTSSSGHADLDAATCANVTRRARFTPAQDENGQPTTGSYSNRIRWVIPEE